MRSGARCLNAAVNGADHRLSGGWLSTRLGAINISRPVASSAKAGTEQLLTLTYYTCTIALSTHCVFLSMSICVSVK